MHSRQPISATPAPARRGPPVWLPWLMAPGFLLLPIGGCGLAATFRRPVLAAAAVPTSAPVTTVAPVAPVVPEPQTVAWRHSAN